MRDMMTINIQRCKGEFKDEFIVLVGTNAKDLSEEADILLCVEDWLEDEKYRVFMELLKKDEELERSAKE